MKTYAPLVSLLYTYRDILFCSGPDAKHWDVRPRMTGEKFISKAPLETWLNYQLNEDYK